MPPEPAEDYFHFQFEFAFFIIMNMKWDVRIFHQQDRAGRSMRVGDE